MLFLLHLSFSDLGFPDLLGDLSTGCIFGTERPLLCCRWGGSVAVSGAARCMGAMGSGIPRAGTNRIVASGEGALVDTGELCVDPNFENALRLKVLPVEFALLADADVDSSSRGFTVPVVA